MSEVKAEEVGRSEGLRMISNPHAQEQKKNFRRWQIIEGEVGLVKGFLGYTAKMILFRPHSGVADDQLTDARVMDSCNCRKCLK